MDLEQLHLTASVGHALAASGWVADDPRVRDVIPTVARGHNMAVLTPPAPVYGTPALAGLLSRMAVAPSRGPALVVCPEAELAGWSAVVATLSRGSGLNIDAALGTVRTTRQLRGGAVDVAILTPETVATLAARGVLKGETVSAIVLAGPDRWADTEPLVSFMPDVPHDCQRVILSSAAASAGDLIERYARKGLVVGVEPAVPVVAAVRAVSVAWDRRAGVLGALLELLDPGSLVVWTADRSAHPAIAAALPADETIQIVTGDAPRADVVVAFDPPEPVRLAQLAGAGEVVLLVPPGTEPYMARVAASRRPLRVPGIWELTADAAAARRTMVARMIEGGRPDRALLTLAPLFERYEATAVAAALFDLWVEAGAAGPPAPVAEQAPTGKVFVGVGKGDGATPNDLVAVLIKEVRVPREQIGRIEIREAYSLVELPGSEVERVATALNGATIRRKRVVARVDRGRARPAGRAGGRAR